MFGFRVLPAGRISPGFTRGLERLARRGYCDPDCVVVKSAPGPLSGISHWGGRYIHPRNPRAREVAETMRQQGIPPPPPPFVVAPGECTLYHEWGHHVDRVRSGDDQAVLFSFRWFSHFYSLGLPRRRPGERAPGPSEEAKGLSKEASAAVTPIWWKAASELFATLFEEWMRGGKALAWDVCDPAHVPANEADKSILEVDLLRGIHLEDVRARTFQSFEGGIRSAVPLPEVRKDFFGADTEEILGTLRRHFEELTVLPADHPR